MGEGIIFWRNMFMLLVIYGPTSWHCTVHVSSNWSNTCTSGRFLRLHSILAESCAPRTTPLPGNSLYWANNLFRNFFIWIGITKDTQLYYLVAHFFVVLLVGRGSLRGSRTESANCVWCYKKVGLSVCSRCFSPIYYFDLVCFCFYTFCFSLLFSFCSKYLNIQTTRTEKTFNNWSIDQSGDRLIDLSLQ